MTYLIFDQNDELLDVLSFNTSSQLEAYKKANPKHVVTLASEEGLDHTFLLKSEEEDFDSIDTTD